MDKLKNIHPYKRQWW